MRMQDLTKLFVNVIIGKTGKIKSGVVQLDAEDVGALPDSVVVPTKTSDLNNDSGFITATGLFDLIYPVGSIYISVNSASPATLFGGTWEQIQDTFLLAAGTTYTAGSTGGEAAHTLVISEMPKHKHKYINTPDANGSVTAWRATTSQSGKCSWQNNMEEVGGDQPHNNMPPYLAVYVWKRTA